MAAVLRAAGLTADVTSLIHAVMVVEQMLTCGGGWQDNVGGLAPGFKIARSRAALPIQVTYEVLDVPASFVKEFEQCWCLCTLGRLDSQKPAAGWFVINIQYNTIHNLFAIFLS